MASTEQRTHYQVLGLRRSADASEVRRAHRQLAQLLHPDRQVGVAPAERAFAERRMREVNAAWTALSDPVLRAEYDRSLAPRIVQPSAPVEEIVPDEPDLPPAHFWLLRKGPVIAALVVGALLFVVTAYAGGSREPVERTVGLSSGPSDCIHLVEGINAIAADCAGPHDGEIVSRVTRVEECPSDTRYVLLNNEFVCVKGGGS